MRLLVTGGAGFIGSNFIRYWLSHYPQDTIINLDVLTYAGNIDNLRDIEDNPNYYFIKGNILDVSLVDKICKDIDIIVHFAAESHVDRSILGPQIFIKTNVLGTQVLLDAAVRNKISRFHHISTDEVFGSLSISSRKKFNEKTPYNPRTPYAASKASSDHLVRSYGITYDLPYTISNCSNNFGPYQYPEKLISLAITNLLEGKKVPLYGDGKYVRDWLYVDDHCRAIDCILKEGKVGETYCIGGLTEDITNKEVVLKILAYMGKDISYIEYVKDRPGHDRKYAIDWRKMKKEFKWEPKHSFDTWLEKTIIWYKKNKWWWKKIKSGEFKKYYKEQYKRR